MDPEVYRKAVKRIEELGYNLDDLKKVPQNGEKP